MRDSASESVSSLSPDDLPQEPAILRRMAAELLRSANASTSAEAAALRQQANDYIETANRIETAARPSRRRAEWLSPEYDI
jgi:hypothetical protein